MIILSAIYIGGRDMSDKTLKISFSTGEITPQQAADLRACIQQYVYLGIKVEPFTSEEMQMIKDLKSDLETGKSQAQRIKAVLYLLWQKDNEKYEDFELYYRHKTELYINHLKKKIDE